MYLSDSVQFLCFGFFGIAFPSVQFEGFYVEAVTYGFMFE